MFTGLNREKAPKPRLMIVVEDWVEMTGVGGGRPYVLG